MIKKHCFSKEWILGIRKKFKKADPILIEKTIYSFELLGNLAKLKSDFVFKGGTSLILLLPEINRLSIDVDIIGKCAINLLDNVWNNTIFKRVEPLERKNRGIPKVHYKFYYDSVITNREDYVLLDIIVEKSVYPKTKLKQIETPFFETDERIIITIPSINSIIGDKLTAFAPETIGIPYESKVYKKTMSIIKQLFDISELFNYITDISEVIESYKHVQEQELVFQGKSFTLEETLSDTINTSFLISQLGFKGGIKDHKTEILEKGFHQLNSYLLNYRFTVLNAKLAASKAAVVATIIKYNQDDVDFEQIRYTDSKLTEIRNIEISNKYKILNKLKAISPESFYYWYFISKIKEHEK